MSKKQKKFRSRGEKIFRFLVFLLLLTIWLFVFLKVSMFLFQNKIDQDKDALTQQESQLSDHESAMSYDKFLLVSDLENKATEMPWFEHIPKILEIFQDLKNLDPTSSDVIILSDFNVSLDEITVKGSVATLKALYYNSPNGNFKSLLNRFEELSFIKDINIRTYDRVGDKYFEFILNAKVISNDGK